MNTADSCLRLAGWLLLIRNGRSPRAVRTIGAGLLLGAVTALKFTNAADALAASVLLLLYPMSLRVRFHYLADDMACITQDCCRALRSRSRIL